MSSLYEQLSVCSEKGINGKPINLLTAQLRVFNEGGDPAGLQDYYLNNRVFVSYQVILKMRLSYYLNNLMIGGYQVDEEAL
ncbi:hypothetical protein I5080_14845 [Salmonella enterica]|nr:hypothetical protein I5080_14845 [Salmonella enterica]